MTVTTRTEVGHLLRVADLDHRALWALLDQAAEMKARPLGWTDILRGQTVACWFASPSTRTRVSIETACARLGALPIQLRPDEVALSGGEPIADIARVLSSYASALVIRTPEHRDLEEVASHAAVPVINALTGEHHPCQALADLLTLRERFGDLRGVRLAYLGDGTSVAHSLLEAGALAGMDVTVAAPAGCWPQASIVSWAQQAARSSGGRVAVVDDPREAVSGAQAVYTDVWATAQDASDAERRLVDLARFRVTQQLLDHAAEDVVFLHCMPATRGREVDGAVIDGPASMVWQQAANRLPTEQALLAMLAG